MNVHRHRHHGYLAFLAHRVSGLALALFIPIHLYVISLLLKDPEKLDVFLSWTQTPAVKFTEAVLIALAALHLAGGIRIVAYEFATQKAARRLWIVSVFAFAASCGVLFVILSAL